MVRCTIKDFYDFVVQENLDLTEIEVFVDNFSDYDFRVLGVEITKPNSVYSGIILENKSYLYAHPEHLVFQYDVGWTKIRDLSIGDRILIKQDPLKNQDGVIDYDSSKVEVIFNHTDTVDLYDLQVEEVEHYYTNDIVSHNSTLSDVIKLGFYGKTKDKPLSRIPNRFNKYGEIDLKFKSGQKNVHIERRFSPSSFNLIEGKVPKDISSKPELQKHLENQHLKMPYHIFDNMVSLSLNDFKSFLKMKPEDKRKIIDKVFSMAVVNDMRKDVRSKKTETQKDIDENKATLNYVDSVIEKTEQEILSLNDSLSKKKKYKTEELENKLDKVKEKQDKGSKKLNSVKRKKDEQESKLEKLRENLIDLNYEHRNLKEDISLYDDGVCPTCGSDLTTGEHTEHKEDLQSKIEDIKSKILSIKEKIDKQQEVVDNLDDEYDVIGDKLNKLRSISYKIVTEINEQNVEEDVDEQTESLQRILDDNIAKRDEIESKVKKLLKKVKFYTQADSILSEDGVKKTILSTIIPELNTNINDYLKKFNLTFKVLFDGKFESNITQYGEEVGIGDISLGESKIFDFCVLISLIRILKTKYHHLNVLFLDEIFASLDSENVLHVLKILKGFSREYKLNIFVINHAPLPKEYFDNFIKVDKDRFSNLEYVEDF